MPSNFLLYQAVSIRAKAKGLPFFGGKLKDHREINIAFRCLI